MRNGDAGDGANVSEMPHESHIGDNITILSHRNLLLTKTWKANGTIQQYDNAKYFKLHTFKVIGIAQLSKALAQLESKSGGCIVRGVYVGDDVAAPRLDTEFKPGQVLRRKALFNDQALHTLLIDVDKFASSVDYLVDPEGAALEYIAAHLPACFQGASFHWQLSNSAGHPSKDGLVHMHLWFWLKTAYSSAALRRWATVNKIETDKSLLDKIQIHYTAAPVIEPGAECPVTQRSGFSAGLLSDDVDLEIDTEFLEQAARATTAEKRQWDGERSDSGGADPVWDWLQQDGNWEIYSIQGHKMHIRCPGEHPPGSVSSTTYFRAGSGGHAVGHCVCKHDSCKRDDGSGKSIWETPSVFQAAVGYPAVSADDFEATGGGGQSEEEAKAKAGGAWLPPGRLFNPWTEVIAPPFPLDTLPEPMARYVRAREQEMGVCPSAVAMSALAAASAALTHESRIYLKKNNNFEVGPALWAILVGAPSYKKTPAMQATRVLRKFEAELRSEREATALMSAVDEGGAKANLKELPPSRRFIVNDVTPEKLGEILSHQNSGILVERDELSSFIGSFDQYGGKGGEANRGFYLSAYNGQSHNIERITRATLPIPNLSVSILAGVQMKKLQEFKKLDSDGLLQRFLPVIMREPTVDNDEFDDTGGPAWESLLRALAARDPSCVHLTPEAMAARRSFADAIDELIQASVVQGTDSFTAFLGKLSGTWGRIALVLHALHGLAPEADLPAEIAAMATKIIDDFAIPNGLVFYNTLTQRLAEDQEAIGAFIAAFDGPEVQWRDLTRGPRCLRGIDLKKAHELLVPFMAGGWLTPTSWLPNNNSWRVHPGVGEYFRKETERHQAAVATVQAKIAGRSQARLEEIF